MQKSSDRDYLGLFKGRGSTIEEGAMRCGQRYNVHCNRKHRRRTEFETEAKGAVLDMFNLSHL